MPNHSCVLYVKDVRIPTALALKMEERNRTQVNPRPSSQRTMSFREYRNLGLGEGAAGSAASNGKANDVETAEASKAFVGLATGKKDAPPAVRESRKYGFGVVPAKIGALYAVSFDSRAVVSGAAISCACAAHTPPNTSNTVAKSFMMMLPSEGWPHAWE